MKGRRDAFLPFVPFLFDEAREGVRQANLQRLGPAGAEAAESPRFGRAAC